MSARNHGSSGGGERKNYAHLSSDRRSAKSLELIYVDKVGPAKEADLVQLVRDVERVVSGDDTLSPEQVVFDGLATLGKDVVLKYLIGFKIEILLPILEAGAADRWEDADVEEGAMCLRRVKRLMQNVLGQNPTVH